MAATYWKLVSQALDVIGEMTPIPADCGQLCGAACCQGEDSGMLLFPGEAPRLWTEPGFRVTRIDYMGAPTWLLLCDGNCDRRKRPLNCRIFPLAPKVEADGRVRAVPDPRGRFLCPLADGRYVDRLFHQRVERALQLLAAEPRMLELMRRISQEVSELEMFFR